MPVDRLVTIAVDRTGGFNPAGVFVPDADPLVIRRWASVIDLSVERTLEAGGARGDAQRIYRVRWTQDLASSRLARLRVWDEYGASYTVTRREEVTGRNQQTRRRWLDMECTRDTTAQPLPAPPLEPSEPINGMGDMMALELTELATTTEGNLADDDLFLATTDLATGWNDGTYKGVVVGFSYDVGTNPYQSAAFVPKVVNIDPTDGLRAVFGINLSPMGVVSCTMTMTSAGANLFFLDFSIPANAVVTLWGVS